MRRVSIIVLLALALAAMPATAAQDVSHPFVGVTHIARTEGSPRLVKMHVLLIDPTAPGVRFAFTPQAGRPASSSSETTAGRLDTIKQTTLAFLMERQAQVAINCHFFEPWPAPSPDPGMADLVGLAASEGNVYSPFEANPPKPQAIRPNAPGLNIDPHNNLSIVHANLADPSGRSVAENVKLYNALAGNEQIITGGRITTGTRPWDNAPNPLTVIGLAAGKLVILIVDGRQKGVSEGLSTREAATLLAHDYAVTDAINLDGGGSATLCFADPQPRVVNVPVGINNVPGTLRPVGSNLAIFATPSQAQPTAAKLPASRVGVQGTVSYWTWGLAGLAVGAIVVLIAVRRGKRLRG